mgnify:CR=1 FL=1
MKSENFVRKLSKNINKKAQWFFIAPAGLFLLIFSVAPMLYSFGISLTDYNLYFAKESSQFIGLENYVAIFQNEAFLKAVGWTFTFSASAVVLDVFFGMLLALILTNAFFDRMSTPM